MTTTPITKASPTTPQQELNYYETMYILRPNIAEDAVDSHVNKYRDCILGAEGQIIDTQMRGKRRLAYPIDKHTEGIYVQLHHAGSGQQVAVLEQAMGLSDDVIRYLTIKLNFAPVPRDSRSGQDKATDDAPAQQAQG
ncbi:MAG: 30S ribosomal protein S6 [Synechococcus sp. SB0668_bin_15]|nr:30S ribosomal protein S6 [Synechococcus sp. SB0668_bin_15]MYC49904.1 30S ribosomal protein S6 [Synechococcus sp. SB0662_bin_14]